MSGFTTPILFNQEITDFFTHANISLLINENGHEEPRIKSVPDVLTFTQPEDPSYRRVAPGSLTPLFALHAHYTEMGHTDNETRLSASLDMRKYLRQTMIEVIEKDVTRVLEGVHPDNLEIIQEVNETKQKLIACIDNPNDLSLKGKKYYIGNDTYLEIFNPNWFLYAHFSKLISAAKEIKSEVNQQKDFIYNV